MKGVGPGTVLGGRYAVRRRLTDDHGVERWSADDSTLGRSVSLLAIGTDDHRADSFLDAARRAASVGHPVLVRILDVGRDDDVAYVVEEELAEARTLTELVETGGVPGDEVRRITGEVATALDSARRRGMHHLDLTPSDVLRTPDGEIRLRGLEVAGVRAGEDGLDPDEASRRDAVGVVALAYAGLTGLWPLGAGGSGLGPAPRVPGGVASPSEIGSGVPRDLDAICRLTLNDDQGPTSPGDYARQVAPWPSRQVVGKPVVPQRAAPPGPTAEPVGPDGPVRDGASARGARAAGAGGGAAGAAGGAAGAAAAGAAVGGAAAVGSAATTDRGRSGRGSDADPSPTSSPAEPSGATPQDEEPYRPASAGDPRADAPTDEAGPDDAERPEPPAWLASGPGWDEDTDQQDPEHDDPEHDDSERNDPAVDASADGSTAPGDTAPGDAAPGDGGRADEASDPDPTDGDDRPGRDRPGDDRPGRDRPGDDRSDQDGASGSPDEHDSGTRELVPVGGRDVARRDDDGPGDAVARGTASAGVGATLAGASERAEAAGTALVTALGTVGTRVSHAAKRAVDRVSDLSPDTVREPTGRPATAPARPDDPDYDPYEDDEDLAPLVPAERLSRDDSRLALGIVAAFLVLALVIGFHGVRQIGSRTDLAGFDGVGDPTPSASQSPTGEPSEDASGEGEGDGGEAAPEPLAILKVTAYDPQGDGAENNNLTASTYDGDTSDGWYSENYRAENFGGLKDGLGLIVDLGPNRKPQEVRLTIPQPVDVEVYVAADPDLEGATQVGEEQTEVDGEVSFEVPDDVSGQYVIVWYTGLYPDSEGDRRAWLDEVVVTG